MTIVHYSLFAIIFLLLIFTINLLLKISNISSDVKSIKSSVERLLIEHENNHVGVGLEKRLKSLQKTRFAIDMSSAAHGE